MSKKKKIETVVVLILALATLFMILDYYFIFTKWSAINYGEQLLIEKYAKPYGKNQWSKFLPLDAKKNDGMWRVYDTLSFPDGTYTEGYYAVFIRRNKVIDIGLNE